MRTPRVSGDGAVRASWAASVVDGAAGGNLAVFAAGVDEAIADALSPAGLDARALRLAVLSSRVGGWLSAIVQAPWLRSLFAGGESMSVAEVWDTARAWVRADPSCIDAMVQDLTRRRPLSLIDAAVAVDRVGRASLGLCAESGWAVAEGRLALLAERAPALLVQQEGHPFAPVGLALAEVRAQRSRVLALLDAAGAADAQAHLLRLDPVEPERIAGGLWMLLTHDGAERGLQGLDASGYAALGDALSRLSARAAAECEAGQGVHGGTQVTRGPAAVADYGDDAAAIVGHIVRKSPRSLLWLEVLLRNPGRVMTQEQIGSAGAKLCEQRGQPWPANRGLQRPEHRQLLIDELGLVEKFPKGSDGFSLGHRGHAMLDGLLREIAAHLARRPNSTTNGIRLVHG